jgi:hypothetical protein
MQHKAEQFTIADPRASRQSLSPCNDPPCDARAVQLVKVSMVVFVPRPITPSPNTPAAFTTCDTD